MTKVIDPIGSCPVGIWVKKLLIDNDDQRRSPSWDELMQLGSGLQNIVSKGGAMLRYLRLAIVPVTMMAIAGCSGGLTLDAAHRLESGNDPQGALSQYEQAIKEAKDKSKRVEAYRGRARCLIKLNQPKEGEQAYRDGVNCDPQDVPAKLDLANVLLARKDLMEAKIQLDDAYHYDAKNLAVIQGQAKVFDESGDHESAVAKYKEALTIEPNNIDIHTTLAHTYGLMNKFDEAKKELAEVDKIKLIPKKPN